MISNDVVVTVRFAAVGGRYFIVWIVTLTI
jgi:uncharacterized membrane protein YjgN (DUF898 family)